MGKTVNEIIAESSSEIIHLGERLRCEPEKQALFSLVQLLKTEVQKVEAAVSLL